jgi:hypothetical protein
VQIAKALIDANPAGSPANSKWDRRTGFQVEKMQPRILLLRVASLQDDNVHGPACGRNHLIVAGHI